ncbi:MAG: TPM domain-containing protein [Salinivirgaceae bacterium]|nr:TPM domain-containing protein [Salinivirgaceae bacterium]
MKKILLALAFLSATLTTFADDDIFRRPTEVHLVVDSADVFTTEQYAALTAKLDSFERATTVQIQIYTTYYLYGYDIVDFAQRLGEGWGVGQEGADNGIVIVCKPKTMFVKGEVTIQVGYGIEPFMPDAVCKQIIDFEMIPEFREEHYYSGIDRAVDLCMQFASDENAAKEYRAKKEKTKKIVEGLAIGLVFVPCVLLGIFLIVFACRGGFESGTVSSGRGSSGGSSRRSSRSSSSSHSYGGGHFGGGGARGSW